MTLEHTFLGVNVAYNLKAADFFNNVFLNSITIAAGFWLMQCGDMLCRSGQQPCHTSLLLLKEDLDRLDDIQLAKHSNFINPACVNTLHIQVLRVALLI